MKKELTLSIGLLALGGWLYWSQFNSQPNLPTPAKQDESTAPIEQSRFELLAGNASDNPSVEANSTGSIGIELSARETAGLAQIGAEITSGPSFGCHFELVAHMFDNDLTAEGQYLQLGGRTGKHVLDLNFGRLLSRASRLYQLCDGRFLYNLRSTGSAQEFEFVDLLRLREKEFELRSSNMIGIGGVGGLIGQLSRNYQLGDPRRTLDGHLKWQGAVRPEVMSQLTTIAGNNNISSEDFEAIQSVPDQATVVIGSHPAVGWVPVKIEFLKANSLNGNRQLKPFLSIEFHSYYQPESINESQFVLETDSLPARDMTDSYLAALEGVASTRMAENENSLNSQSE